MKVDATVLLRMLPSPKSSGEGLNLRRSPARADSGRRTGASSGSIVVIVVVVGAKATRLRVDLHFARLPIHGPGHFDISAVARDDDVRPSVRLQLLQHLLCRHWAVSRNESGCLWRVGDRQAYASGESRNADHACDESFHVCLLRGT